MGARLTKDNQPTTHAVERPLPGCPVCDTLPRPSSIRWSYCPVCRLLCPPADSTFVPSGAEGLVP